MSRLARMILPLLGIGCIVAAFGMMLTRKHLDWSAQTLAVLGILLFLGSLMRFEVPNLKHGFQVGVYATLVLGCCLLVYILIGRHERRADLTVHKIHSLTQGTQKFLRLLNKPVEIVVFDSEDRPYRELLDHYTAISRNISWQLVDPRRDPLFTRQFGESVQPQTLYIRSGEKKKLISQSELNEGNLTNGIIEVTRETDVKVYFLQGHGELGLQADPNKKMPSLSAFMNFLASRAMQVDELRLIDKGFVPRDATLIVIAGPKQDLYPVEQRQLDQFLAQGGRLLVLFDVPPVTGEVVEFPQLAMLMRSRGINDQNDVIVDLEGQRLLDHPLKVPVLWINEDHPITKPLKDAAGSPMALTLVRSLQAMPQASGFTITPLVGSSPSAWAEPFSNLGRKVNAPPQLGRQSIGWAVEPAASDKPGAAPPAGFGSRMVVFGSSELVRDDFITTSNVGATLMLDTVNWLAEREDLIAIPAPFTPGTPMVLSESEMRTVMILVVMAFPLLIFFGGISYTRLRRNA